MDQRQLQMLGLFNVAPEIRIKDKEERALETQLLAQAKEFFDLDGDDNLAAGELNGQDKA